MRLRVASAEKMTTRPSAGAGPVLAALPLAALALVPLVAGTTLVSILAASALFLLAAACLCLGTLWPARVDICPQRRELRRRHRRVLFDEVESLTLAAAPGSPAESYEVRVHLRDGSDWLLLSGLDPAQVLRDLRTIVKFTGLPVESGWGMPTDARPWLEPSAKAAVDACCSRLGSHPLAWGTQSSQRLVSLSMTIAAILTAVIMVVLISVHVVDGEGLGALSLVLALGLVVILFAVAAATEAERVHVEGNGTLVFTIRSWGLNRQLAAVARTDLIRAYTVQAASRRHLLLETRSGPIAIPSDASAPLEAALGRHGSVTDSQPESAQTVAN